METLKEIVCELSAEHNERKGFVTCEFSLHKDKIEEFERIAKEQNLLYGNWILMECETCVGYHGEGFVHASIEKFQYIEEMKQSSNFILVIENKKQTPPQEND